MKKVLVHHKAKEGIPEGSRGRRSSGKGPGPARRGDTAALSGRRGHMERGRQPSGGRRYGRRFCVVSAGEAGGTKERGRGSPGKQKHSLPRPTGR